MVQWSREWSGVERSEWSGVEWSGVEWSGVGWSGASREAGSVVLWGVKWSGVEWSGWEWSVVEGVKGARAEVEGRRRGFGQRVAFA